MESLEKHLLGLIIESERPRKKPISVKFPKIKNLVVFFRQSIRKTENFFSSSIKVTKGKNFFKHIAARHQSVLIRQLGNSSERLQKQKIVNLKIAINKLNGMTISPGKTMSLWSIIGKPTRKKGYVKGMTLSNGAITEELGGGLCQLSNFLFWIFLHVPVEVIERHHHSKDVFPDSGRVLPFGSGATIFYNYVDLKIKNISNHPLQLKIWVSDKYLKGQILMSQRLESNFHVFEKNHYFIKRNNKYFRYNEIWREEKTNGKIIKTEEIITNFAPVMYEVNADYLKGNNFKVLDFTDQ
jgi:vancomycin resistance protein VanW